MRAWTWTAAFTSASDVTVPLSRSAMNYWSNTSKFVVSLLKNPVDQKVIKLIAEIGHEAGMKTIAEYVQNAEALSLLEELGVDMAQGYFVGRPSRIPRYSPTPISLQQRRRDRETGKLA